MIHDRTPHLPLFPTEPLSTLSASDAAHTTHTCAATSRPSWASLHDEILTTSRLSPAPSAPFVTRWSSPCTSRTSLSTRTRPRGAPLLARVPSLSRCALVVVTADFVHVCAAGGEMFECPLPNEAGRGACFAAAWASAEGVVVEVRERDGRRRYFGMGHPLEEMVEVTGMQKGESIAFCAKDVGVGVGVWDGGWRIWAIDVEPLWRGDRGTNGKDERVEEEGNGKQNGEGVENKEFEAATLRTRLVVREVYREDTSVGHAQVSALLSHSAMGELAICVVSDCVLKAFRIAMDDLSVTAVSPAFVIPNVACAVGVGGTRQTEGAVDILVLSQSKQSMVLYAGQFPMCGVSIPEGNTAPIGLTDTVGSRVTLCYADGSAIRFSLRHISPNSVLVNKCLATISRSWYSHNKSDDSEPSALTIRRCLLHSRIAVQHDDDNFDPVGRDLEWLIFVELLVGTARRGDEYLQYEIGTGRENNIGKSHDDWSFLLSSEHHKDAGFVEAVTWCKSSSPSTAILSGHHEKNTRHVHPVSLPPECLISILEALHLLCEDMKLSVLSRSDRSRLSLCIVRLAAAVGGNDISDYYCREYTDLCALLHSDAHAVDPPAQPPFAGSPQVPSIFEHLCNILRNWRDSTESTPFSVVGESDAEAFVKTHIFPTLHIDSGGSSFCHQAPHLQANWRSFSPLHLSEKICRYFDILFNVEGMNARDVSLSLTRPLQLLRVMCSDCFGPRDLDALPFGVAIPLREALWACRNTPGGDLPVSGEALIGREDLWGVKSRQEGDNDVDRYNYRALARMHAASATHSQGVDESGTAGEERDNEPGRESEVSESTDVVESSDGCDMTEVVFALRFGEDRRVSEVRRLLSSADPVLLRLTQVDPDVAEELPEGERPNEQPWLQNQLSVLLKRHMATPIGRGAFTLRTFEPSDPTQPLSVPKLCLMGKIAGQRGAKLSFNAASASYSIDWGEFHNGVAAGLRLVASGGSSGGGAGVNVLTRTWIVNHRPSNTAGNASHAGMLLALGLGGYLPALRATDYYEYLVPMHELTTIGLMLGVAAGNRASLHSKITKMLCVHIRHFNGPGFAVPDFHVSLTVQAAAVVGLGLLYQATCERLIVEGLLVELSRRPQPGDDVRDREGLSLAAGLGLGLVCLGIGEGMPSLADLRLLDTLILYAIGGADPSADTTNNSAGAARGMDLHHQGVPKPIAPDVGTMPPSSADSETSRVRLGNFVDVDVTGPGAVYALALVYLQSNDSNVAQRIVIPNTMYALDRARPDHVYMRCLAKHLIMWDSIQATREWVLSTLPELLRPPVDESSSGIDLSRIFDEESGSASKTSELGGDIDEEGILLARAFAVAGACMSVSFRNAGSMNESAIEMLTGMCTSFESALLRQAEENEEAEWVFATCLSTMCLALSIVAAGSGDLDILRLLRRLRKRSGPSLRKSRYGTHMAIHMAIGFLFLGGGCQTFGTSKTAVAALMCAVHPRFPCDVEDNQYHLQALRHLYVLAVEPRCIEARDVDTDLPCAVAVNIKLKNGHKSLIKTAPCLLPDARMVESISVVSERYWPKVVDVLPPGNGVEGWFSPTDRQILYVKRRAGHLPYSSDPTGSKGLLARSFQSLYRSDQPNDGVSHLVRAFSADPQMLSFVRHFCSMDGTGSSAVAERYGQILYECLSLDKPEAVNCYLDIERALEAVLSGRAFPTSINSLALLIEYASIRHLWGQSPLVRRDFLWHVRLSAHRMLRTPSVNIALAEYFRSGGRSIVSMNNRLVGRALQLFRVPAPSSLSALPHLRFESRSKDDAWMAVGMSLPVGTCDSAIELAVNCLHGS